MRIPLLLLALLTFSGAAAASGLCERMPVDPELPAGLAGGYDLIGKDPTTGNSYSGTLRINYGKRTYAITRTSGNNTVHGDAWMERCGMDKIEFFRARYYTKPVTDVSCSLDADGDNYYRTTCRTWQAGRRGLEAWFQNP
jgi:hypothetical protein